MWRILALGLFTLSVGLLSAQTPTPAAAPVPAPQQASSQIPGIIIAKRVTGTVTAINNSTKAERVIQNDDRLSQGETVQTSKDRLSSVILVFSNGATIQLKADSQLNIEEFMMDSWDKDIDVANLKEEPSTSKTKLSMARGELIGKVAHLNRDKGSSFEVKTPVGAAGIRGTTFRIVFRPDPVNPTRLTFSVSTAEGHVELNMQGTVTTAAPVPVTTNKEIVVNVDVKIDAKTGSITVTAPPVPVQTAAPISPQTTAVIAQATQQVVEAIQNVVIATPPPAATQQQDSSKTNQSTEKKDDTKKDSTTTDDTKKDSSTTTTDQKQTTTTDSTTTQSTGTTPPADSSTTSSTTTSSQSTGTAAQSTTSTTSTTTTTTGSAPATTTPAATTPATTTPVVTPSVVVAPPVVPVLPRITSGEGNAG